MSYEKAYLGKNYGSLDIGNRISSYSNIILNFRSDSEEAVSVRYPVVEVPGDTYEIELPCVTNSQHALQIAQNILSRINQYSLNPYKVTEGYIDPAVELGDGIMIDELYSTIGELQYEFDPLSTASIGSFIQNDEIEDEFQFESSSLKRIERIIAKTSASFRIDIDRIAGEVSGKITTFRQATVPTALATGDLWYCTANITGTPSYEKDTWYRWSGSTWEKASENISIPVAPAWASGTGYHVGDVVDEGGVWYAAKLNHTSSNSNKPPNTTYWEVRNTISEVSKSQIIQTMDSIVLGVSSASNGTKITLTSGETTVESPVVNLHVNALNIDGKLTANQIATGVIPNYTSDLINDSDFQDETGVVNIIDGTIDADYINAFSITARNIKGNKASIYGSDGRTTYGAIYAGTNQIGTTALELYGNYGTRITSDGNVWLYSENGGQITVGKSGSSGTYAIGGAHIQSLICDSFFCMNPNYYGTSNPSSVISSPVEGMLYFKIT